MTSEVKNPFQPPLNGDHDSALYEITQLINNLQAEECPKRIASVDSLLLISSALGPDRTRNELMPFLTDLLDDEETVLIRLSLQLGDMLDYVGGPQHASDLLNILEKICALEELSVREHATESIKKILSALKLSQEADKVMLMIRRLNQCPDNTTKYTTVHLIPFVYSYFSAAHQQELMDIYVQISNDPAPQVRKQASIVLNSMIKLVPKIPETELFNIFSKFYRDQHDSVRM